MKLKISIIVLLALCLFGCQTKDGSTPSGPETSPTAAANSAGKGEPSPKFNLTSPDGSTVSFDPSVNPDHEAFLLVFWSQQWDPNVTTLLERTKELHERYAPRGLTVIAVSYDDEPGGLRKYLNSNPLPFEVAVGASSTLRAFQIESLPAGILVDQNGRIVDRWNGYFTTEELSARISPYIPGRTGNSE